MGFTALPSQLPMPSVLSCSAVAGMLYFSASCSLGCWNLLAVVSLLVLVLRCLVQPTAAAAAARLRGRLDALRGVGANDRHAHQRLRAVLLGPLDVLLEELAQQERELILG
eukprot:7014936-Pyramimonas_sp.AAC.2